MYNSKCIFSSSLLHLFSFAFLSRDDLIPNRLFDYSADFNIKDINIVDQRGKHCWSMQKKVKNYLID